MALEPEEKDSKNPIKNTPAVSLHRGCAIYPGRASRTL